MACVPAVPYARLRDIRQTPGLNGTSIVAQSVGVLLLDYDIAPDGTEQPGVFGFAANDAVAIAAVTGAGGANLGSDRRNYHLEFSFDGAQWDGNPAHFPDLAIDYVMLVEQVVRGLYVELRGRMLFGGYKDNAVDRLTLNSTLLGAALGDTSGEVGTILPVGTTGTTPSYLYAGAVLPQQKGLFQTVPGPDGALGSDLFQMFMQLSQVLTNAAVTVDADSDTNFLDQAALEFIAVSDGMPIGGQPLGSYSHFVGDSSSAELNVAGLTKGIGVGTLGTTPHLTFVLAPDPTDLTKALIDEGADQSNPLTLTSDFTRAVRKMNGIGGYSNHGLPDGFRITQGTLINVPPNGLDTTWDANLYLFVGSTGDGLGGLYFWAHDGLAYRIGQEIDGACSLAQSSDGYLYVAGRDGVFRWQINSSAGGLAAGLERVGGLHAAVQEVRYTPLGVIAWLADASGQDGLLLWNGPHPDTGHGYDGWQVLAMNGPILAWAAFRGRGDSFLLVVTRDNPTVITKIRKPEAPSSKGSKTTTMTTTAHIRGMSSEPSGYYGTVWTDAGAAELHLLSYDNTFQRADPDTGDLLLGDVAIAPLDGSILVDGAGNLVQVNAIQLYANIAPFSDVPRGQTMVIDVGSAANPTAQLTATFFLLADTDSGIYVGDSLTAPHWRTTPPQSGLSNQSIIDCQVAYPQTVINRTTTRLFAVTTSGALYVSHSAGFWFDCETEEKVTIGAFLTALYRLTGQGLFLDNTITAIQIIPIAAGGATSVSIVPTPAGLGTSGNCLVIATSAVPETPDGMYWVRPLNERNKWTYRVVNANSPSLTGKFVPSEFISIQADATTPAAVASGKLALALLRKMQDAALQEDSVTIPSVLTFARDGSDTAAALRTLRPSYQAAADYDRTPVYGLRLNDATWWVTRQRFYKNLNENFIRTESDLSTVFRTTDPSDQSIGDALADSIGKVQRLAKIR